MVIRSSSALLLLFCALIGCSKPIAPDSKPVATASESAPQTIKGTIGFSALTLTNPFFKVIADTMKEEAAKRGYDVVVVSAERDVKVQADQVNEFIVKGVSGLRFAGNWPLKRVQTTGSDSLRAGIPFIRCEMAWMYSGVVPQQPPTMFSQPSLAKSST